MIEKALKTPGRTNSRGNGRRKKKFYQTLPKKPWLLLKKPNKKRKKNVKSIGYRQKEISGLAERYRAQLKAEKIKYPTNLKLKWRL